MVNIKDKLHQTENKFPNEFITYFENKFHFQNIELSELLKENERIAYWEEFYAQSIESNAISFLKKCFPQLRFPIAYEIEKSQIYKNAVLKGQFEILNLENELQLINAEQIKISIYDSFAGKIPVILIPNEFDFIKIVQCLLYKNNPTPVPLSMGALMINGINNWDRLNKLKKSWTPSNLKDQDSLLQTIQSYPHLYKDRLIICSTKPYSNVAASKLKMGNEEWLNASYIIRLEHECTHLYTLKNYASASNNLHDELIADYIGITKALGKFKKEWMLEFLGLEDFPKYRKGARLENYLESINLDSESFGYFSHIIYNAIENISIFDDSLGEIQSNEDRCIRINCLCETGLLNMASENGGNILVENYKKLKLSNQT